MRVLFVHQNFPGQYRHVAAALAEGRGNLVLALGEREQPVPPGVQYLRYKPPQGAGQETHRYIKPLEAAVRRGQETARAALALRARGFSPDIICCHPGWGEGLFLRDVWPQAKLLYYFEYFYRIGGGDVGFDPPGSTVELDDAARVRTLNAHHLISLEAADWGQTPTRFQHSRFPSWARDRITVLHEGVDTRAIRPDPTAGFTLPDGRVLRREDEVVTFVARGLEPYRGFHSFMRALPAVLRARPRAQVVMVGGDEPHYGRKPPDGGSWREVMLRELDGQLDTARLHFPGKVPHAALHQLFGISAAHVYLTYPFVLSWSMLEAMACECLIIGSATAPVQEVIEPGRNGLLVDFFNPDAIAATVIDALERPDEHRALRQQARRDVVARYDLQDHCLPEMLALIRRVAETGHG